MTNLIFQQLNKIGYIYIITKLGKMIEAKLSMKMMREDREMKRSCRIS